MIELGVNIDHVATLRQARRTYEPDPVWAAGLAELGGADGITVHLREDRRHIQDRDLELLKQTVTVKLNLELACESDVIAIACRIQPHQATLVPERRQEVTTEGGLDICSNPQRVAEDIKRLVDAGIFVSLFLDPDMKQLDAAARLGCQAVELHTGSYALARGASQEKELKRLTDASDRIVQMGLRLHAGHGLNYQNVVAIAMIPEMRELNIGHAIISRCVFTGLRDAVAEMKTILRNVALRRS